MIWLLAICCPLSTVTAQGLIDDVAGGGAQGMTESQGSDELDCYECDLRSKQELLYSESHDQEKDQVGKGIKEIIYDPYAAPFINVRNFAGTTIFLPLYKSIEEIYIGDPQVFRADYPKDANGRITRKNVIKVSVNKGRTGADTPLTLLGSKGKRQYKFILSSYNHNTQDLVPDFWVSIVDPASSTVTGTELEAALSGSVGPALAAGTAGSPPASSGNNVGKDGKPEWLREIETDPSQVKTDDYDVRIASEEAREIAPDSVWHDGFFTYLKYNEDRSDIIQRASILSVIDDYNSPVKTEAIGPKSNIIAVQSVGRNIFLGNGQKIVCIIWTGNNTRVSG